MSTMKTKYSYEDSTAFQVGSKVQSIGYPWIGEVVEREPDAVTVRWDWGQIGRVVGSETSRLAQIDG